MRCASGIDERKAAQLLTERGVRVPEKHKLRARKPTREAEGIEAELDAIAVAVTGEDGNAVKDEFRAVRCVRAGVAVAAYGDESLRGGNLPPEVFCVADAVPKMNNRVGPFPLDGAAHRLDFAVGIRKNKKLHKKSFHTGTTR